MSLILQNQKVSHKDKKQPWSQIFTIASDGYEKLYIISAGNINTYP